MGKLVPFARRTRATKKRSNAAPGEVVLFTGVRYERTEPTPGKPAGNTSGAKRRV